MGPLISRGTGVGIVDGQRIFRICARLAQAQTTLINRPVTVNWGTFAAATCPNGCCAQAPRLLLQCKMCEGSHEITRRLILSLHERLLVTDDNGPAFVSTVFPVLPLSALISSDARSSA